MARVPIYVECKANATGDAVSGATVTVTKRVGGGAATLYSAETGGTTVANPIVADSLGRASAWADRGDYNAAVAGTGITGYTLPIDAASGADGGVAPDWISWQTATGGILGGVSKLSIDTVESTTSTSFVSLATPDSLSVVMPTDGIFLIFYRALWKTTTINNEKAGVFLGANQVVTPSQANANPVVHSQSAESSSDGTYNTVLTSYDKIQGKGGNGGDAAQVAYGSGFVETYSGGPIMSGAVGGPMTVFAAAGTYTVGVRFMNTAAGTVTVKNRRLHVYTMPF